MSQTRTGLYPGTFDPLTNGHLDIISRATKLLDRLVIAVAINPGKGPAFSLEERVAMVEAEMTKLTNGATIEVMPFRGLLVDFADEIGANIMVRGLRAVVDYEYEFQLNGMNSKLNPNVESIPDGRCPLSVYIFLSGQRDCHVWWRHQPIRAGRHCRRHHAADGRPHGKVS